MTTATFDRVARSYDRLWSSTAAGRAQREAVWRHIRNMIPAGSRVLDLGCGTGDDALMLAGLGSRVTGIDASPEMVSVARERGVDARAGRIEDLADLQQEFDFVISNFGALNCIERLGDLRGPLARAIRPGGTLAICLMNRVCLWETVWYALQGNFAKATRRWSGQATSSLAQHVYYPTVRSVCRSFAPDFALIGNHGIGLTVPPSCVRGLSDATLDRLAAIDGRLASLPILRSLADHRLLIFSKSVAQ